MRVIIALNLRSTIPASIIGRCYDRILCMELFILFLKVISKDIPIAVSAAAIANNNTVIAKIFISLIVIAANIKKI